jgi:hypothetical protein
MPKYRIATIKTVPADALLVGNDEAERLYYAPAIIGVAETPLGEVVVYDADGLIEILESDYADEAGDEAYDLAVSFFEYNMQGSWNGERSPIHLYRECMEHDMATNACPCPMSVLDHWGENRIAEAAKRAAAAADSGKAA